MRNVSRSASVVLIDGRYSLTVSYTHLTLPTIA